MLTEILKYCGAICVICVYISDQSRQWVLAPLLLPGRYGVSAWVRVMIGQSCDHDVGSFKRYLLVVNRWFSTLYAVSCR